MSKKKSKKYIFWIFGSVILVSIILFVLYIRTGFGIGNTVEDSVVRYSSLRGTSDDTFTEYLSLETEPFGIGDECLMEHEDCIDTCIPFDPCYEEFENCTDECDITYPYTVEIELCQDECYETYTDEDDIYECEYDCDIDYMRCTEETCYPFLAPCLEDSVDCIYTCLEECVIEAETAEWDGSAISDVGEFFENGFPQFTEQFSRLCETMMWGDFVSDEDRFGCEDTFFMGEWFAPYLVSLNSFQEVCGTVGLEWVDDGKILCER